MLNSLIIKEFQEVRETFKEDRKTRIEDEISELEVDHLSLIPNEQVMVTMSQRGYFKRVSLRSYASSQKETIALMDDDVPIYSNEVNTTDTLVFTTSKGRYGMMLVYEMEEARWRDTGPHMNQFMKMDPDERIISAFTITSFNTYMFVVTTTAKGMIKKTAIEELEVKRTGRLYDIMKLGKNDSLVGAHIAYADDELLMVTHSGQNMRLELTDVAPIGIKGKGIIGIKTKADDSVVASAVLHHQSEVVYVSDRGQFKRIKRDDIAINNRATQGVAIVKNVKSNPHFLRDVFVGNIQDDIIIYHNEMGLVQLKDVPLMAADATFSSVSKETSFVLLHPPIQVPLVEKPLETAIHGDEPLKFDI